MAKKAKSPFNHNDLSLFTEDIYNGDPVSIPHFIHHDPSFSDRAFHDVPVNQDDYEIVPAIPGSIIKVIGLILLPGDEKTEIRFNSGSTPITPFFKCDRYENKEFSNSRGLFKTAIGEALTADTSTLGDAIGVFVYYETIED